MGSNLRRYALWQMRDFVRERGIALLLVGSLMGFTVIGPVRAFGRPIDAELAKVLMVSLLQQVAFITALITLNGLVSGDRVKGYYRFLFSKPVSIPAYYAQNFLVYFVGFLAANAVLMGIFAIFAHPVSPLGPLAFCALVFLSFGGIAFFVSSLFKHDWAILVAVFLGSAILHSMWKDEVGWRKLIVSVLPPLHKLTDALPDIMNRGVVNTQDMLWLLGYNALFFAAGLFILHRRPIG